MMATAPAEFGQQIFVTKHFVHNDSHHDAAPCQAPRILECQFSWMVRTSRAGFAQHPTRWAGPPAASNSTFNTRIASSLQQKRDLVDEKTKKVKNLLSFSLFSSNSVLDSIENSV